MAPVAIVLVLIFDPGPSDLFEETYGAFLGLGCSVIVLAGALLGSFGPRTAS